MTTTEIKGFAQKVNNDKQFAGKKVVVILPKNGKKFYISLRGLSEDRNDAFVYDYDRDGVGDQFMQVVAEMGQIPEIVEVN
jgi:hypothetical protein